jgi:hypothetical protein
MSGISTEDLILWFASVNPTEARSILENESRNSAARKLTDIPAAIAARIYKVVAKQTQSPEFAAELRGFYSRAAGTMDGKALIEYAAVGVSNPYQAASAKQTHDRCMATRQAPAGAVYDLPEVRQYVEKTYGQPAYKPLPPAPRDTETGELITPTPASMPKRSAREILADGDKKARAINDFVARKATMDRRDIREILAEGERKARAINDLLASKTPPRAGGVGALTRLTAAGGVPPAVDESAARSDSAHLDSDAFTNGRYDARKDPRYAEAFRQIDREALAAEREREYAPATPPTAPARGTKEWEQWDKDKRKKFARGAFQRGPGYRASPLFFTSESIEPGDLWTTRS